MKILNPLLLLAFIACCATTQAQDLRQRITAGLDTLGNLYPYEKIYVHTDRRTYTAGESIWCKVYCMLDAKPSFLSSIAYIELVDKQGKVLEKRMLKLVNGTASADIFLKEDLPAATYQLNAYTSYMLNWPAFIYRQPVFVYNTDFKNNPSAAAQPDYSLAFFPEGGDLVTGVTSRVAFKAVQQNGLPLHVSGDILDSKGQLVTRFSSMHNGMGAFELTPAQNEKYKAVLVAAGKTRTIPLPDARQQGAVLKADNSGARIFVEAKRGTVNENNYNELLLVCQMNHVMVYMANLNFAEGLTATSISRKNLPAGILQITLFDKSGQPLSERLVFNGGADSLPGNMLRTDTLSVAKRKKNVWQLDLSAFNKLSASAAVVNDGAAPEMNTEENIRSAFLLSSDLKGYIHQPGYYFKDRQPATVQALDLLMMTHGWRRFNWQDVMAGKFPPVRHPIETGIWIKGKVLSAAGGQLSNAKADIITKGEDSTTILSTARLNGDGDFIVDNLEFRKGANIYVQGTNLSREKAAVDIVLTPSFIDTLKQSSRLPETDLNPNAAGAATFNSYWQQLLDEKDKADKAAGKMLAEVVVTARKRTPLDSLNQLYASDLYRQSDRTIPMDTSTVYASLWQFLTYKVPGLEIGRDEFGEATVQFRRYGALNYFSQDTQTGITFFLNEVQVTKEIIESIDINDIALIKTWEGPSGAILGADRGAIGIYTLKGRAAKASPWAKYFQSTWKMGYSAQREFFHMDYADPANKDIATDKRPTLYWMPDLKTDASGKATIRFYNDDQSAKFRLVVQGMDKDGRLLYMEKQLQ